MSFIGRHLDGIIVVHRGLIYPARISSVDNVTQIDEADREADSKGNGHITFAQDVKLPHLSPGTLYVPPPKERNQGMQLVFLMRRTSKPN